MPRFEKLREVKYPILQLRKKNQTFVVVGRGKTDFLLLLLLLVPWAVLGRGQAAGEGVACPDFEFFFCSEKTEMMLVVPSERTFFS